MTYPFTPYKIDTAFNGPASYGPHEGVDLNSPSGGNTDCGYELKAIKSGVCEFTSKGTANYGNLVVIRVVTKTGTYYVRYCHCDQIKVEAGQHITEGQVVATMGNTGNSTTCHLHLDILKKKPSNWRYYTKSVNDWFVDPIAFIKNEEVVMEVQEDWEEKYLKEKEDNEKKDREIEKLNNDVKSARDDRGRHLMALGLTKTIDQDYDNKKSVELIQSLQQISANYSLEKSKFEETNELASKLLIWEKSLVEAYKQVNKIPEDVEVNIEEVLNYIKKPFPISTLPDSDIFKEAFSRLLQLLKIQGRTYVQNSQRSTDEVHQ